MHSRQKKGFILLEVMVAVAIFMIAIVGIMYSIDAMIDTVTEIRMDRHIRFQLETYVRTLRSTTLLEGTPVLEPSNDGVTYLATIEKSLFSNQYGAAITGLWHIKITATYKGPKGEARTKDYEVLAYQP